MAEDVVGLLLLCSRSEDVWAQRYFREQLALEAFRRVAVDRPLLQRARQAIAAGSEEGLEPAPSPRSPPRTRPVPSRDSHDREKTATSVHSTPALAPLPLLRRQGLLLQPILRPPKRGHQELATDLNSATSRTRIRGQDRGRKIGRRLTGEKVAERVSFQAVPRRHAATSRRRLVASRAASSHRRPSSRVRIRSGGLEVGIASGPRSEGVKPSRPSRCFDQDEERGDTAIQETRDRIQTRLDEAELVVAEADRDYMRRRREELGGPSRGSGAPPAAARRGGAEDEEDGGRAFGDLRGLEDASSTLAALMERMSGEASSMARLQEAGHEGERVKGLSGFYSVAQLLTEFQEMVMDAGAVRDIVASSFDAMEGSISALRAAMDEQQWLVDAEREMYGAVVEGFLREINVGSNRMSSPGEGARTPTLQHDSDATENCLEELQSTKDETMRLQSERRIIAEESDSRQCYHSKEQCIYREEAERLAEERIDSDVRSEPQCVLYTAASRDLVKKLAVLADVQRVTEERDEVDIRREVQIEIYSTIVKNLLKGMAADSVDHLIKTFIKDEVHAVFLAKTLNSWKSTTEMPHNKSDVPDSVKNDVEEGLEDQRKEKTGEIGVGFSVPPENGNKKMFIPSTKFQAMFMDFEAVMEN
ncbi:hypothetical protein SETIT_5G177700v2 [Setaria italica]|uniref:Uncharacterized protein n=1 Tax=Setaria italica TaxID=4555 RepID=A0A368R5W3_SETIT|nr:hypothetical protein SETIT_5G177700v2 [Setaria italica]